MQTALRDNAKYVQGSSVPNTLHKTGVLLVITIMLIPWESYLALSQLEVDIKKSLLKTKQMLNWTFLFLLVFLSLRIFFHIHVLIFAPVVIACLL